MQSELAGLLPLSSYLRPINSKLAAAIAALSRTAGPDGTSLQARKRPMEACSPQRAAFLDPRHGADHSELATPDRITVFAAAAADQQRPVPTAAATPPRPLPRALLLHQVLACLGVLHAAKVTAFSWITARADSSRWALNILYLAWAATTVARPRLYWRHRVAITQGFRLLMYLFPSFRNPGATSALMLANAATPGWQGAIKDFIRVLGGTRLLLLAVCGVVLAMPPGVTLVAQAALLALTANNTAYCSTQLLSHPLTQRRARWLASHLELGGATLLALNPAMFPHASSTLQGRTPPLQTCTDVLLFLQVSIGVLLPTVCAARLWQQEQCAAEGEAAAAPPGKGLWGRVARAGATLDSLLCRAVHRPTGPAWGLLACCWLLTLTWCACCSKPALPDP